MKEACWIDILFKMKDIRRDTGKHFIPKSR
jgi:hypothetical protein